MKQVISARGFQFIMKETQGEEKRLVSQSSAIGENPTPGSSYLWVGSHHLDRDDIRKLIQYLQDWLSTGRLWEEV